MESLSFKEFVIPAAFIGSYIIVTLCKSYPRIKKKHYPLIAVLGEMAIATTELFRGNKVDIYTLISGASYSGLMAIGSYELGKTLKRSE